MATVKAGPTYECKVCGEGVMVLLREFEKHELDVHANDVMAKFR